ncbi:M23 family metallopeptidase [Streptomyces sp. C10-9-1]|uniref:M23 family metallopeptidase n=1 Tax=Streptomyces sp. C10-9-1 TaxID=1859285 RepID=UPI0021126713|nr:M23 family metallopeptidase [Streptomyces sp. C10-9-1]MCQ6552557.1 M23 family metallopeptidase [Streptomyces sp. C10-9-1]
MNCSFPLLGRAVPVLAALLAAAAAPCAPGGATAAASRPAYAGAVPGPDARGAPASLPSGGWRGAGTRQDGAAAGDGADGTGLRRGAHRAVDGPGQGRGWPVGRPRPVVLRGWDPPPTPYGAGHRGVDLAAPAGSPVRAAAAGRVSFAGRVAGRGVLSIEVTGTGEPPLRLTHEPVRALVARGDEVAAGQTVGVLEEGRGHCSRNCLHWGLLRGEEYLDPLSLLPPGLLRRGPSRLLPVSGVPLPGAGRTGPAATGPGRR